MQKIIVVIKGGLVQEVYAPKDMPNIDVEIIDEDTGEVGDFDHSQHTKIY